MGKLFRGLAIFLFVVIVLGTVFSIREALEWYNYDTVCTELISGLLSALLTLPLYVLGNMVDEVKEQRQKINYLMVKVRDVSDEAPKSDLRKKDPKVLFPDHWQCSCGRSNAGYISTCACGKNRHEAE